MEPEGSSPYSQVPTICPYPEPLHPVSTPSHFPKMATKGYCIKYCYIPGWRSTKEYDV